MRLIDADALGDLVDSHGNVHYEDILHQPTVPQISGNAVNLCETCKYDFPECPKDSNVIFGDGKGNDNVCACSAYEVYVPPISKREWYQKGYEAGQKSVQPQRMRRGYWKSDDSVCTIKQFECSVCEELVEVPMILNEIQWQFCPHCGAKMGGQDETRGVSETP